MFNQQDYALLAVEMSQFLNEKYDEYQRIWIEYDEVAFILGIIVGLWGCLFVIV